ncbi:transcriptional regulator GcvA [Brucella gallinifaecis]|uniref:transcriptional regulator GcvA n=1 Tax=Brucella gallinifaecis TaxID=215590 RepID=UPI002362D33F|nr:transcriptional regulator GcvA [Brucella gallinifaecis]
MNPVLPLLALRAFVETGRHCSIKQAAEAMGVTSGAVSQQIRQLEDRLGVTLFTRTRYGVRLTEAGAKVHPGLLVAFDQIAKSLETLEEINTRPTLTISTVPSFAASWLVPRLGRFTARQPDIEVRVEATSKLVDLGRDRVDIAIRHGLGHYPGLVSEHLMAPVFLPVASPKLLGTRPPIKEPVDCLGWPLLQDSDRADWHLWFKAVGVADDPRAERGPSFEDDYMLVRAAIAGQGLALVRDVYAAEEIASGRLALALDRPWPAEFAYYAVTLPDAARRQPVRDFIHWLKEETAPDAGVAR